MNGPLKPTAFQRVRNYRGVHTGDFPIARLLEIATGKDDLERIAYKDDLDLLNACLKTPDPARCRAA